jgi:hypothetical protein
VVRKRDEKAEEKQKEREAKMKSIDFLLMNEKKIHSRATAIQCPNKNYLKVL